MEGPWNWVPQEGEASALQQLGLAGYLRQAQGRAWEFSEAGRRAVLRAVVPEAPTGLRLRALNLVADYDLKNRTKLSDYKQWMDLLVLRKRLPASTLAEKDAIINSLLGWYLEVITGGPGSAHFRLTRWGWFASAYRPAALRLLDGLIDLFWEKYDQDVFDIHYTLSELRQRGAVAESTDPHLVQEIIAGFRLDQRGALSAEEWDLARSELTLFVEREYENADDFLDDRGIQEATSKATAHIVNSGQLWSDQPWFPQDVAYDLEPMSMLGRMAGVAQAEPWSTPRPASTPNAVWRTVGLIVDQFKHMVECRNLWRNFWHDSKPCKEKTAQLLFYAVAQSYCKANDLDLTPEPDTGRGPVDFKVSAGFSDRLLVEVKLSTNRKLIHGYETQLELYREAEQTTKALYLIIDVGGLGRSLAKIQALRQEVVARGETPSEIVVVDATPKISASKADGPS